MHGTASEVQLFFHLCRRYWRGNLSPVTLHYLKVSHERVLRGRLWVLLSKDCWEFYRWPFTHLTWTQKYYVLYNMWADASLYTVYVQSACVLKQISQTPSSHKKDTPAHVFQEGKQKPAVTILNNFNKGRSTKFRKSWRKTHPQVRFLQIVLISKYYRGPSQQLGAIICQTAMSVYPPKRYLFHTRYFSFMIQPLRHNWLFCWFFFSPLHGADETRTSLLEWNSSQWTHCGVPVEH